MYTLIAIVALFVVSYFTKHWELLSTFFFGLASTICLILLFVVPLTLMCQLNNIETLQESQNVEKVLNQKAETLTVEFTRLLAEVYPQHEKDLFEKMTPDRVLALVIKYPEIKANTTVMELVTKIDQMRSAVYDQQILREKLKKDIRFNKRNPFLIQFFIPKE